MLLKKAGTVVVGAAAGMLALSGAAFAGEAPCHTGGSTDSGHSRDHGHSGHHHSGHHHGGHHGTQPGEPTSGSGGGASARNGDCSNSGNQLVGVNCTNVQAPINQLGIGSSYLNADGSQGGGASARNGNQTNTGSQLVGVNGTNAQAPINQLGVLSQYTNL